MPTNLNESKKLILKLRDIRRSKGLTINALAEKTGLDHQKIGRLERGETQPSLEIVSRVADVLQVPLSDLLEENAFSEKMIEGELHNKQQNMNSVLLIPLIYEKLESLCEKTSIDIDNTVKVYLATVIFKGIQDIHTNIQNSEEMVEAFFQVFDAIFERLVVSKENQDSD